MTPLPRLAHIRLGVLGSSFSVVSVGRYEGGLNNRIKKDC